MTAHVVTGATAAQGQAWVGASRNSFVELLIDLSKRNLSSAGFATGDTIKVFAIPAGTLVLNQVMHVVTPEGAAATLSVGDSGSATRYHSAVSINSTAGTMTASATTAKLYSAADYLLLTLGGTMSGTGVAKVALCFQTVDVSNRQQFSLL
jgi:hypothetical protein